MKVLVVVDMQEDFVSGVLGSKEAVSIIPNVVEKIKAHDGMIVVTKDTHYDDYMRTQEGKNLPVKHCTYMTSGWELDKQVADAINAKESECQVETFIKGTFGSTDMGVWLKAKDEEYGLEEITLIGVCTDICVISNAMLIKAFLPEVPVVVDAFCCAGVTPESHDTALAAMKSCQIKIENE